MKQCKSYTIDRSKKFAVIDKGKIISKHVDFFLAQSAVERHLKNDKITNDYDIVSLSSVNCKK